MKRFPRAYFSVYRQRNKFIEVGGVDATKFLQGMCTNDVALLKKEGDCIATSFLTTKGKVFADSFVYYKQVDATGKYLIETELENGPPLLDYLKKFKLRSKVNFDTPSYNSFVVTESSEFSKDHTVVSASDPRKSLAGAVRVVTKRKWHFWCVV